MKPVDTSRLESSAASLGEVIPITAPFADALLQLHHAAQIAAEVGKSWAPPQPDDSHSNFEWHDGFLLGAVVPAPRPFRAALRAQDLALRLVAEDGAVLAARLLTGATLAEATSWVRAQAALFAESAARQPATPAPDLPPHPVAGGAPFAVRDRDAWTALARLFAGADAVLRAVAANAPDAAPVRIWPHHFDIATLIAPDSDRSVGVGLAVPDSIDASGYWYVSPWSANPLADAAARWPSLSCGTFVARGASPPIAVLPLAAFAQIEKPQSRIRALAAFLGEAIAASASRLGF